LKFILIDKILELQPGKYIVATKQMDSKEEIFKDHFPGFPVLPGVLLTEMIAQAAGKCLDMENKDRGKAILVSIKSASFLQWVFPEQLAMIHATIKSSQEKFATAEGYITVNNKKVCKSDLLFSFVPYDQFAQGYVDEVVEQYFSETNGKTS